MQHYDEKSELKNLIDETDNIIKSTKNLQLIYISTLICFMGLSIGSFCMIFFAPLKYITKTGKNFVMPFVSIMPNIISAFAITCFIKESNNVSYYLAKVKDNLELQRKTLEKDKK